MDVVREKFDGGVCSVGTKNQPYFVSRGVKAEKNSGRERKGNHSFGIAERESKEKHAGGRSKFGYQKRFEKSEQIDRERIWKSRTIIENGEFVILHWIQLTQLFQIVFGFKD